MFIMGGRRDGRYWVSQGRNMENCIVTFCNFCSLKRYQDWEPLRKREELDL